ncbi:MAG: hypothetical protein IJA26_00870 [Clostridia bacterium]|nr:hypothetical protein [Clostridia bacterium]
MMKKIISVLVLCALLVASVVVATGEKANDAAVTGVSAADRSAFGFEILEMLYEEGNTVISPLSLEIALSMAADGAKGETLAEILSAMNISSTEDIASSVPEGIHSANAAFTSDIAPLYREYVNRLNEAYGAEWFKIDENVVENANKWANKNTNGLIDPLLTEKPDSMTGLILMNAVAMDADWQKPFYESGVQKEMFHAPGGDVEVDMMHQTEYFLYSEKDGVQIISLPYANSNLSMYVMLPEEGCVGELVNMLSEQGVSFFSEGLENTEVVLGLPKMDISAESNLNEALQQLGVSKAFTNEADFSGMSEMPMFISEIFQKARILVDESGTKAAASTVIAMPMMAMPPSMDVPPEMIVDRPFAFAIMDDDAGAVCFAGIIENPLGE